jgi:hypothetical protein
MRLARTKPSDAVSVPNKERPKLTLDVPPEIFEAIAQRAAEIVRAAQGPSSTRWLDSKAAAEHLCCTTARIHDLVALGKLIPRRDGRRLLFDRAELDAYIAASA